MDAKPKKPWRNKDSAAELKDSESRNFTVTQALVALLAKTGGTGLTRAPSFADNLKGTG